MENLFDGLDSLLVFATVQVFELVDCGALAAALLDSFEDLRELFEVLLDDINTLVRVFPVGSHVVGASGELVVGKAVVLVHRTLVAILHKSNKLGHVQFLGEILNVETQVDDHLLTVVRVAVRDQERAGDARNNARLQF